MHTKAVVEMTSLLPLLWDCLWRHAILSKQKNGLSFVAVLEMKVFPFMTKPKYERLHNVLQS